MFLFLLLAYIHKQSEVRRAWGFRERWAHVPQRQWGFAQREDKEAAQDRPGFSQNLQHISHFCWGKSQWLKILYTSPLSPFHHGNTCSRKKMDPRLPQCSKLLPNLIYYWPKQSEMLEVWNNLPWQLFNLIPRTDLNIEKTYLINF